MSKFNLIKKISLLSLAGTTIAPTVTFSLSSCSTQTDIVPKNVDGSNWIGIIDGTFTIDDYEVDVFTKTITYIDGSNIWAENLVIPNFVFYNRTTYKVKIGEHCFENAQYIYETVEFNDLTESVPDFCFSGCKNITNLIMHRAPSIIGDYAFSRCSDFKGILIRYSSVLDDSWWINLMSIGLFAFEHTLISGTLFVPKTLISMSDGAFSECFFLTDVNLRYATQLTRIPNQAFWNCYRVRRVSLPESITSVGHRAFAACQSLRTVDLNSAAMSVSLGSDAFSGCTNFIGFSKPIEIAECGANCFLGDSSFQQNLWNQVIDPEASWCGGMEVIPESCFSNTNFLSIKFASPDNGGPTEVERLAFNGCASLSSIDMTDFDSLPNWHGTSIFSNVHPTGIIYVSQSILVNGEIPSEWTASFMNWGIRFDESPFTHTNWKFEVVEG